MACDAKENCLVLSQNVIYGDEELRFNSYIYIKVLLLQENVSFGNSKANKKNEDRLLSYYHQALHKELNSGGGGWGKPVQTLELV